MRRLVPLVPLVLLLLAPGTAAAQNGSEARLEVEEVAFVGNEAFSSDSLRLAIVNRETECRTFVLAPLCWLDVGFADDRHYFRPRELARDAVRLELYYWQRGYREADADTSVVRDEAQGEVRITFHIEEGRPVLVDTVLFTGDPLPNARILRNLPLDEGDPLSGILLDASRDSIQTRLQNAGYAQAEVFRSFFIPADTYDAEVELDIFTGPFTRFGEIDVRWTGGQSLSRESVLRFLPFQAGDVYSREELLQAQRSLFAVELIQSARIVEDTVSESPDSVVPLIVTITEGDVHRVGAGGGFSTADCFNTEARWTSRNFMGAARRLTIRGRLSNVFAESLQSSACRQAGTGEFGRLNWLASVELFQPWIFSTRNSLTMSVYGERTSLQDVFVREAVGATVGLSRLLGARTAANITFQPQLSRLQAAELYFCTSFLVCTPSDIDVLLGANWMSPIGLGLSHDRTDDLLNPSNGWQARVDVEHASGLTGSNFRYNRVVGEASWYDEVARRTVIAARLRGGWIGSGQFVGDELDEPIDVVHPQKRFYAGGASSVRGFAQNRLGPRVLITDVRNLVGFASDKADAQRICSPEELVSLACDPKRISDDGTFTPRPTGGTRVVEGNVEYRFAFGGDFQGVGFLDFGQVWRDGDDLSLGSLEFSPGVGVRYFSPVGPIRLDVGYRFRGAEHLSVVTSQIRPFMTGDDPETRICIVAPDGVGFAGEDSCDGDRIPIQWVRLDELAVLRQPYVFGRDLSTLQRLQLHFSIGQAF